MTMINIPMTRERLTEIGKDLAEIHAKMPDSERIAQQLRRADTMLAMAQGYDEQLRRAGDVGIPTVVTALMAVRDELSDANQLALLAEDWYKTEKRENY